MRGAQHHIVLPTVVDSLPREEQRFIAHQCKYCASELFIHFRSLGPGPWEIDITCPDCENTLPLTVTR